MTRIRLFIACLACRLIRLALRLAGRGGTSLPGKAALRLFPGALRALGREVDTVLVTGTNGKTTTAGMLRHMLDAAGAAYISNPSGANLIGGITAEFILGADLLGRPRTRWAVIECDEGNLAPVAAALQPRAILVTNLFRDQLDRYGEVSHTRRCIAEGIRQAPEAALCLNADCSLTASLGDDAPNPAIFYGLEDVSVPEAPNLSDAPRCLACGGRYAYRRHTFAHLGDWYCPDCGRARPAPELCAADTELLAGGSRFTLRFPEGEQAVSLALPALYNVYNALSALAAARAMGWDLAAAAASLADFGAMFGRMETLRLGEADVRIVLVKNPAGCDRALEYLASLPGEVYPVFCLNDNINDGTDVSWIWDADYERLFAARSFESVGVFGLRRGDMRLRLKYAGAADDAIVEYPSLEELARDVARRRGDVVILPNYTAMLSVRDKLSTAAGGGRYWE